MRVIPDKKDYIRGYVYSGSTGSVPYTSEQVVWLRYFNPLAEYAGLSPVAPLRLSVDMGQDALRFNRNFFKNSARPDIILTTEESMTDDEVAEFYERWESRYPRSCQCPQAGHRQLYQGCKARGVHPERYGVYPGSPLELGGCQPCLWGTPSAALRLSTSYIHQHQVRRAAVLAEYHDPGDEVHGRTVEPKAAANAGLR